MRVELKKSAFIRLVTVLLLMALALSLVSCAEEKIFGHCEITLSLPDTFNEYDSEKTYDKAYTDGEMIVGILRISYSACSSEGIPTTMTPRKLADYYKDRALSGAEVGDVEVDGDLVYYCYKLGGEIDSGYTYLATFYFTPYAYFVITYIAADESFDALMPVMLSYARTFRITPEWSSNVEK